MGLGGPANFKMPPSLGLLPEPIGYRDELRLGHLGQVVEVHDGPAARSLAANDVAARRLVVPFAVQAVRKVGYGLTSEGRQDLGRRGRCPARQGRDQVNSDMLAPLLLLLPLAQELLEHLERVGAVTAPSDLERCRPELGVLGRVMGHAAVPVS